MIALERGSTMVAKNRKSEQPSKLAASRNSSGMVLAKKVRAMIRLYTLTLVGRIMAQMVSYRPSCRTSR